MYLYCSVCNFDFNYIIHYEYLEEEEKYFVEDLNASNQIKPHWENSNKMNISNGEMVAEYFNLLTDDEIRGLYRIYKNDFLLFKYNFQFRNISFDDSSKESYQQKQSSRNNGVQLKIHHLLSCFCLYSIFSSVIINIV